MKVTNNQETASVRIPISSMDDIIRFQKSLIRVLDRVEIDDCSPEFREDLATVYRLLSLLISVESQSQERSEKPISNSLLKISV